MRLRGRASTPLLLLSLLCQAIDGESVSFSVWGGCRSRQTWRATSAPARAPRRQNKVKVLEALKDGPMTASEIANATGIATGTVSYGVGSRDEVPSWASSRSTSGPCA